MPSDDVYLLVPLTEEERDRRLEVLRSKETRVQLMQMRAEELRKEQHLIQQVGPVFFPYVLIDISIFIYDVILVPA